MAVRDVILSNDKEHRLVRGRSRLPRSGRWLCAPSWLAAVSVAGALVLLCMLPADAQRPLQPRPLANPPTQFIPCPDPRQPLVRVPEIVSQNGVLRGTIVLSDEGQRMDLNLDPTRCVPQFVRKFRGADAVLPDYPGAVPPGYPGYVPPSPLSQFPDPMPGPTLRARVGDIVQLTLLNHVDPGNYGDSIDRGERDEGCDQSSVPYPGPDTFPNCFHGSSTGNIHFHGTHTSPKSTGDNIFLEVRPSPRKNDKPIVTEASVREPFDKFFAECGLQLSKNVLSQWPRTWSDLPPAWVAEQENLLRQYDSDPTIKKKLWPVNAQQWAEGAWPQYYIGAFPFCFRLPEYGAPSQTAAPQAHPAAHAVTAREQSRGLKMGQAPGIHWYHAHKHGSSTINVMNGMTGAFIIEGEYDDALNTFYEEARWTRRQPVLVINQLGVSPPMFGGGNPGLPFSVNGRRGPKLSMRPGEVQLWRIVNTSSRSGVFLDGMYTVPPTTNGPTPAAPAPFQWKQLAQDGVQLARDRYEGSNNPSFLMAAGNRVDLLVKAPDNQSGQPQLFSVEVRPAVEKEQTLPPNPTATLMFVEVSGQPVTGRQSEFIPPDVMGKTFPQFLADITPEEVIATKRIVFESANGPPFVAHTIDGKKFDGSVGQVVLLDTVEEWKLENRTIGPRIDHPFHIHINPFQVVEVFDPNETLVNDKGQPLLDKNGKPAVDSSNNPLPKYVTGQPAFPDLQCELKPDDQTTWRDCHNVPQKFVIWRDVFPIPAGKQLGTAVIPGYFKMRSRFVDYAGQYVIHCHILAHEDRGMMTVVQVVPYTTPYSHH